MKKSKFAAAVLAFFKKDKYAMAQLEDGTQIMYEGDKLDVNVILTMNTKDDAGNEKQIPVPGGEHKLGGDMAGKIIVVEEATGKVLEIKDAESQEEEDEEGTEEEQAAAAIIAEMESNRAEIVKLNQKISDLATQIVDGKVDKSKFVYDGKPSTKKLL